MFTYRYGHIKRPHLAAVRLISVVMTLSHMLSMTGLDRSETWLDGADHRDAHELWVGPEAGSESPLTKGSAIGFYASGHYSPF